MKTIHPNSVAAYWAGSEEMFGKRHLLLLAIFRSARSPISDREAMIAAGATDPNFVRPRISELIEAGILDEVGSRVCPVTGKTVRLVKLHAREVQAEFSLSPESLASFSESMATERRTA